MNTKIEKFRQELNRVFDDNLRTKQWQNYVDYAIIGLIVISTLEVFLSTYDGIVERYGKWLTFVDYFTTIFFTIEVSLRIWCADLLNPKYKGLWGRIKYCFSFYGMIDILSTYPFYLHFFIKIPYAALKALRIARLLRIFRYMNAFSILSRAIKAKKQEMVVSLQFLAIITLILSFILFFVEHEVQPDVYNNGWRSVVWAFAQYIGDPGGFADTPPISFVGRLIACAIGILGIAIFAVPAGLIGSAFTEVMGEDNHEIEIEENKKKLHLAFERKMCRFTRLQIMPLNLSIQEIIARMRMTENEIIEAVEHSQDFRIINIASTVPVDERPMDKLAIEHFIVNRPYGCMIDRGSKVTIVSPASLVDPIVGAYSYYFAKLGGFNYISREIGELRPYKSFYNCAQGAPGLDEYMSDIEKLSAKDGSWVVTLLAASGANEPELPSQIHLTYGGKKGDASLDAPSVVIRDKEVAKAMFADIENVLESEYSINTDRQKYHDSANQNMFMRKLSNAKSVNGLIIRIAWSCMYWDSRRIKIAQSMAEVIKKHVEPEVGLDLDPELKAKGIAYEGHTIE